MKAELTPEFALIARHFTRPARKAVLGVGDDCALVQAPPGHVLAITTDMLVAGTHFVPDTDPRQLGHKALAVNLSDLAAMGAAPEWFTLALALPAIDEAWLSAFAAGLLTLADQHGIELIGGDTTRGPLTLSVTAAGSVPAGAALRRDGALPGDEVWVSGTTGDAALGLAHLQARVRLDAAGQAHCLERLHMPQPRIKLGLALRGLAHGAADVSDGLLADMGHILQRSQVAADLHFEALPRSAALRACADQALAADCLVAGGDDYELVFTAPAARRDDVLAAGRTAGVPVTRIGIIRSGTPQLRLLDAAGQPLAVQRHGFDHFAG
jgi:thiamine-monophosphate kinase